MRIDFYWFNLETPIGYSIGVAILSEELKQGGHEVRLSQIDDRVALPWDLAQLTERAATYQPDVVAVSFNSAHASHARQLIEALDARLSDPKPRIVVGGVHATIAAEEVIEWPGVAALGRGECDGVLAELVERWQAGDQAPKVDNFWIRRPDGELLRNPLGPPPSLEGPALVNPDLDWSGIIRANRGLGSLSVSRGCPYGCSYCHNKSIRRIYREDSAPDRGPLNYCRRRSVDDSIAQIQQLQRRAQGEMRLISFDDDTLLTDRDWFAALARRIKADLGLPYLMNGTLDRIDDEVAELMEETGCLQVRIGVESGSERLYKEILRRYQRPAQVVPTFELLRRHHVNTRACVMVGIPTESRAELESTFELCGRAQADGVRAAYLRPFPRTEIYTYCVEQGLLDDRELPPDYSSETPLNWPTEHALVLRKVMPLFPWMLSVALPDNPGQAQYRELLARAWALDAEEWDRPETTVWLRRSSLELDREHRTQGIPHYLTPFPDRPDSAFLIRPDRRHRFPNVDDRWPPDAPWAKEPLA